MVNINANHMSKKNNTAVIKKIMKIYYKLSGYYLQTAYLHIITTNKLSYYFLRCITRTVIKNYNFKYENYYMIFYLANNVFNKNSEYTSKELSA